MEERTQSDDLRVIDRAETELEDVARALARLDEGTYATCEACGVAISADRLAELPLTRRCTAHGPQLGANQRAEI